MRIPNIDLEASCDLFPIEADAHLLPEESAGEDALTKFLSEWTHGIDSEELQAQTSRLDAKLKVAKAAAPAEVTADTELAKMSRRLSPQALGPVRIEEEIGADGNRIRKTYNAKTGDLVRVQILEADDE